MVDFNDRRLGREASPNYGAYEKRGIDKGEYTRAYQAGWRHSGSSRADLDNNPHGGHLSDAWEDGYMDNAVGREKFALRHHRYGTGDPVEGY